MNKVASIVPLAHLDLIEEDRYFMALSYACSSPEYVSFFRRKRSEGAYVILDNSVVEKGEPERIHPYISKAIEMDASEVLMPDYLNDPQRTLDALGDGLMIANRMGYTGSVMAVPQGRDQRGYMRCVKAMLEFPINTIGISRRYTEMFEGTRKQVTLDVIDTIVMAGRRDVKVHLLGCWDHPRRDFGALLSNPRVRGIDGSLPSILAREGIMLEDSTDRPETGPIDILTDHYNPAMLEYNLMAWRRLAYPVEGR